MVSEDEDLLSHDEIKEYYEDEPFNHMLNIKICKECRMRMSNPFTIIRDMTKHTRWHQEQNRILNEMRDMHGLR